MYLPNKIWIFKGSAAANVLLSRSKLQLQKTAKFQPTISRHCRHLDFIQKVIIYNLFNTIYCFIVLCFLCRILIIIIYFWQYFQIFMSFSYFSNKSLIILKINNCGHYLACFTFLWHIINNKLISFTGYNCSCSHIGLKIDSKGQ